MPGDELLVSGQDQALPWLRRLRGSGLPAGRCVEPAPCRPDRARLPAHRRASRANRLRTAVRAALDAAGHAYPEYLPPDVRTQEALPTIAEALEAAHYPLTFEARDAALRRLAFDELLALQLGMVGRRRARGRAHTAPIPVDAAGGRPDPRVAARVDLAQAGPSRGADRRPGGGRSTRSATTSPGPCRCSGCVQGDVGSGKTAVAAWSLAAAALAGRQAALLAPTDLLARQHLETVASLLEDAGHQRDPAHRVAPGGREAQGPRGDRHRPGAGRGGHARPAVRDGRVRRPGARRGGRAAPVRRRAARGPRGEGPPGRAARPAHDGDADPADAGPGPLRGPRRVDAPVGARGPDPDPHGDPAPGRARRHVGPRARGGRGGPAHVRRGAAHRAGAAAPDGAGEEDGGWAGDDELPDEDVETAWAAAAEAEYVRLTRAPRAAARRARPRSPEARRPRRGDGPLPRRRPRRARGHDRRRGGRGRAARPR